MKKKDSMPADALVATRREQRARILFIMWRWAFALLIFNGLFFCGYQLFDMAFLTFKDYLIKRMLMPFACNLLLVLLARYVENHPDFSEERKAQFCTFAFVSMGGSISYFNSYYTPLWCAPAACMLACCMIVRKKALLPMLGYNIVLILLSVAHVSSERPENRMYYTEFAVLVIVMTVFMYYLAGKVQDYHYAVSDAVREITRQEQEQERKLRYDYLTGVYSRAYFTEKSRDILRRRGDTVSLAMFDLDSFKKINDTYGHDHGDTVLNRFGHILRSYMNDSFLAGRYGGEEFVVLLCGGMEETDAYLMGRILSEFSAAKYDDIADGTTASCGLAIRRKGESYEELLIRADKALYQAKAAGKNRYVISR